MPKYHEQIEDDLRAVCSASSAAAMGGDVCAFPLPVAQNVMAVSQTGKSIASKATTADD